MQIEASILTGSFEHLLSRLPPCIDLDGLAREHKALRRCRGISGAEGLLRLALARGPGGLSLRESAAWAGLVGVGQMSNPAVKARLDLSAGFLEALVGEMLAAKAASGGVCWHGRTLRLCDGTSLSQPGSTGTDWRVHGVFDLGRGGFSHLELTDVKGAESLCRGAPIPGEVRIGDRYFAQARAMVAFLQACDGKADFITRLRWNALRLQRHDGKAFDLIATLAALPPGEETHDLALHVLPGRFEAPLPVRVIIRRLPPDKVEAARAAMKRSASRKQRELDPRSLVAAEFMMLVTSLPEQGFAAEELIATYRLRWQIELAFKRMKSLLRIDRMPTVTEKGSRPWLFAHLIMALLCDDASQQVLEASP